MSYLCQVKAVEEIDMCIGCAFYGIEDCLEVVAQLVQAGLPACETRYIYIIKPVPEGIH